MSDKSEPKGEGQPERGEHEDGREDHREREARERDPDRSFRRLGDQLFSSLLGEPSAAFKRGQGLVSGVAQETKEEVVRMISAEFRGFLDKMDAADLVQEIVSGLVIEMKGEVRFRRAEDGRLEPDVRGGEAKLRHEDGEGEHEHEGEGEGEDEGEHAGEQGKGKRGRRSKVRAWAKAKSDAMSEGEDEEPEEG